MNGEWKIFEGRTFIIFGVLLSLVIGVIFGGIMAAATGSLYLSGLFGMVIALWVGFIYFQDWKWND